MGKLLGRIFKEDIKSTILWLILPLALAIVFTNLLKVFGENPLVMIGIGITMTAVVVGPFVALISVAVNDYERFYGKYASFYSAIPLKARSILASRFINYILMFLVAAVFAFANFMALVNLTSDTGLGITDIFRQMQEVLAYIGGANFISIILYMLLCMVANIMQVIFAITAGSSRIFGKPSKGKILLIFIVVSLIIGLIFAYIQANSAMAYENSLYFKESLSKMNEVGVHTKGYRVTIAPIVYNIIVSLLLGGGAYYLHDKKLSVA